MKLAYPFGTRETVAPLLGYRGDEEEVFLVLKDLGYSAIEPLIRNPRLIDSSQFERIVIRTGIDIAPIGTGPVVSDDKLTFTDENKDIRTEAVNRTKDIIEFASLFGSQISVGKLRGNINKSNCEQSWKWMCESIEQICEHAEKYKVNVTLEPQNINVINNLNSTREALNFIRKLNLPNLTLMLDVYHMNFEDSSITESLLEAKDYISHVHFADSNRRAPGNGELDFYKIIRTLRAINYSNYISLEISQEMSSYDEAKSSIEYLKKLGL
ncbi:sugar phosphate isomerase/epimerase family protein [Metabacillus bambusae]|uniref:Sugar phosphate isomerase/epimerase n=1 Tax=Metabacillus bambusae TaxID=2795218 RepID=A0ABS3MZR7_9BACI|nr:sugar phosphate isomerase/epimerase family protein [Metabacillus bambusae]MBO1511512.1 sugar phosphate isomerase/epimerase [Metabacillus bambusae]